MIVRNCPFYWSPQGPLEVSRPHFRNRCIKPSLVYHFAVGEKQPPPLFCCYVVHMDEKKQLERYSNHKGKPCAYTNMEACFVRVII